MTTPGNDGPSNLPAAITLRTYHREHPSHIDSPNTEVTPELANQWANHPPTWFTSPNPLYLPAYNPDHVYLQRFHQVYIDAYYQNILSQNDSIEMLQTRAIIIEETNAALRADNKLLQEAECHDLHPFLFLSFLFFILSNYYLI